MKPVHYASATEVRHPHHVAIIMDGNGRWATQRGRPRAAGHVAGAKSVRRVVESARRSEIETLTLYAFSSDNWSRPGDEVNALMALFRRYLAAEVPRCVEHGISLRVIGRRDRLSPVLRRSIAAAEEATSGGRALRLRIAIDYSAREMLLRAAAHLPQGSASNRAAFAEAMGHVLHDDGPVPDVDLLIRTGGEQRLSDFLLWECAYAELVFSRCMWPDFGEKDFEEAIADFADRDRRFGGVKQAVG